MKNKTLRILSLGLAVTTALSTSTPVFAYDVDEHDNSIESVEYQNTEDEDFTNMANVFAELGSEYKVTIPKVVVLSGVSKAASYYVKVEGDIAGYEKVNVIPEDSFKLSAKNKADETATIQQDKTTWTVHDFNTDANGTISAENITAGKWTGAFNFNINLEDTTVPKALAAGLYDENDNLIKSWDELIELGLDIEKDYKYSIYEIEATSGYSVFENNNLSGKLIIPDSVTKIGNYVFKDSTSLKSVIIPDSVTSIGSGAFYGCTSLESVTLGKSVTSIGFNAFKGCTSLTSITIPNSVTSIGSGAFNGCTSLKLVTIPDSVTSIGENIFSDCISLESVTLGKSVTSISNYAFSGCTSLESVIIPDSVTSIGENTFDRCKKLTSIIIPDSVTSIGYSAFNGCASLESIIIPDSVTSIGNWAFSNCTSLTTITYRGVTYTDKNAFNDKLKSDGVATADAWT